MRRRWSAPIVAAALAAGAACAAPIDETARELAGLDGGTASARALDAAWSDYERRIGSPMRDWGERNLPDAGAGLAVFYPFSGPDFPTVAQLYPRAGRYVLVAIQPAGPPPDLDARSPSSRSAYLATLAGGLTAFARSGFFRTLDLDAGRPAAGATPALMALAARLGYDVHAVEPVRIAPDGNDLEPHPGGRAAPATWASVRITLARDARRVLLDYVQLDLSDARLARDPAARAWIERQAANPTVFKAASHLPQKGGFSIVRDAVLARAPSVVQDETGIDYAELAQRFDVALHGRFVRPHPLFGADAQRSLAAAYRERADVPPLAFRIGYEKDAGSNLQVATRAEGGGPRAQPGRAAAAVPTADAAAAREREMRRLEADLAQRLARYEGRPRKVFVSASTTEEPFAAYVQAVRARLAKAAAPRGALVSVAIAADGSVRQVDLEHGAGAGAARQIRGAVAAAGPFPPLPETIRARVDVLVVTLTVS
ncbi:MAG: TonB C-terminal domain-containing protein [Burkholderiales bacterium]|nr:TonB C-terminal domain-containing protein [Burkholderiales bacterium]